ncbi:MAG: flagellar hook-basal body complex protein FliE [Methanomassiliicoccales archaeon]|nr:MAG: flagellar hook-basal body complex protein FliE [Methanomassiliicoccales archaeon]
MSVLVISGMPGAGKEEFAQVAMSVGYQVVRMGDVVRAEAARQGIAFNDQGVGGFANEERKRHGYDIWAKRAVEHVKQERTVIDGSRGLMELEVFKKELKDVRLIAIHTCPIKRFHRLKARGREDAPSTYEDFKARDERELGWGIGSLIAMADIMIVNEGTLEEFKSYCLRLLRELD